MRSSFVYFVYGTLLLFLSSCQNRNTEIESVQSIEKVNDVETVDSLIKQEVPTPVKQKIHTIIKIEKTGKNKCEVDVRIQNKLTNPELESLANKIKQELDSKWEVVYIFFFLPKMEVGNGAWARVTFDPHMKLHVIGQTIEQEGNINNYLKSANNKRFIGQWVDNFQPLELVHRMKIENNKVILDVFSPSEKDSSQVTELRKVKKGNQFIYKTVGNDFGEYYIINNSGDLEIYDAQGYIATYSHVK